VIGRWFGRALGPFSAALFAAMGGATALAQQSESSSLGAPVAWGLGLQASAGPVKEAIHDLNSLILWIIVAITIFVLGLLGWVVYRYRAEVNPNPSRTSHNTTLEIAWTVIPVLILVVIAIPSFRLIYFQDRARDADMTINVQGRQWYWHYQYPDHGNMAFDSRPIPDGELKPGQLRNLSVDEPLVVPAGANIRVLTTGQDVIHSFFVPSLGVQKYTIPGRTLEMWFRADQPGTYYGQCNQICGTNHWFMPIEVRAVPQAEFQAWVEQAKKKYARADGAAPVTAAATPAAPAADEMRLADARR
jgi:cytochrome c oxidase subunit 2